MRWLELKIPPPVVGVLTGVAMWALARVTPVLDNRMSLRIAAAAAVVVAGVTVSVLGIVAFRTARTTVNPLKPDSTSSIVVSGVYGFTRNPMYLGMVLGLMGWAIYLAAPAAVLGPAAFIAFITRFQIVPEERVLSEKFGRTFADYASKVRRWL